MTETSTHTYRPVRDFFSGFARVELWWRLAWAEINQIYRRTFIGIAWIMISFMMFIAVKIFVFGAIVKAEPGVFELWVTIGFWVWLYISGSVIDGCNVLIRAKPWILGKQISLGVFIAENSARHFISFALSSIVVIVLFLVYKVPLQPASVTAMGGLIMLQLNNMWVQMFFGILCLRHRDIIHFIGAIMRVMFFLTPILYMPDQLGKRAVFLDFNPFTHYLAIVRDPLLLGTIPVKSWIIVCCITVAGWFAGLLLVKYRSRTVPFWV